MRNLIIAVILIFNVAGTFAQNYYDALKESGLDEATIQQYEILMESMGVSENELQKFANLLEDAETPRELADAMEYLYRLMEMDEGTITMMRNIYLEAYQDDSYEFNSDQNDYSQNDGFKKKEYEEEKESETTKNYNLCNEQDNFDVPFALKLNFGNKPLNELAFINYIKNNGEVLYSERGVKLYYLIDRAVTQSGLKRKICQVDKDSGRDMSNNNRKLYWYQLYMVLENGSEYEINFSGYPCYTVEMISDDNFNDCSTFLCAEADNPYTDTKHADRFGNSAKTTLSGSPHIMGPDSRVYDFEGAWHYTKPTLDRWKIAKFTFKD